MKGKIFTTIPSNKEYYVIEKHKVFKDVWRCIPTYKLETLYKSNLIQCFSEDFIQECLDQEAEDNYIQETICQDCNGSGEGSYDGSTCIICKGKGEI